MAFKDIAKLAGYEGELTNVVLSHAPCPDCVSANGKSLTYSGWEESQWGLPGSDGRICGSSCHCVLVPNEALPDLPAIGEKVKLRGDEDTDIRKVVEIGPNEQAIKDLMDTWNSLTDGRKLPPEIYKMPFDKIMAYLKKRIAELRVED